MYVTSDIYPLFMDGSGFIAAQPALVQQKIDKIVEDGPDELAFISDWDKTAIQASTWQSLRECLPRDVQKELRAFVLENVAKLDNGMMTLEESMLFTSHMLDVLRDPDLPPDTLSCIRLAMARIPLVDGGHSLFNRLEQAGIETVIGSAGIADFIGITATANGIAPSHIVATPLQFERGRIQGWDEEAMTHDLNKHTVIRRHLAEVVCRRNEIVTGDRPLDTMMARDDDALLIQVGGVDPNDRDKLAQSFAPKNENHRPFDLVAIQPGLVAVDGLMGQIISRWALTA